MTTKPESSTPKVKVEELERLAGEAVRYMDDDWKYDFSAGCMFPHGVMNARTGRSSCVCSSPWIPKPQTEVTR